MSALLLVSLLIVAQADAPGNDLRVLPDELNGVARNKMLYTFLLGEARKHFDSRRAAVAELKTAEDVTRRQLQLRNKFIESLGGFPERTPPMHASSATCKAMGSSVRNCTLRWRSTPESRGDSEFVRISWIKTTMLWQRILAYASLTNHRRVRLAPQRIAELSLDHGECGLDVGALVVMTQKFIPSILKIVEHLFPQSARLACMTLHECNCQPRQSWIDEEGIRRRASLRHSRASVRQIDVSLSRTPEEERQENVNIGLIPFSVCARKRN